jgi:hypothetical protein
MDDKSTPISSLNNNVNVENDAGVVNQILNKYNNIQDLNQGTLPSPNKNVTTMENDFENRNLNQELYNLKANNVQYKEHHDKEIQRVSSQNQGMPSKNNKQEIYEEEDEYVEYEVEELPLWKRIINELRIFVFIFIFILCIFNSSFDKLLITRIPFFGNQFNESNIMGFLLKAFIVALLSYIFIRFVRV